MNKNTEFSNKTTLIVGLVVWAVVFTVYNLTKAPTLSFWDCGEFIAAAVKLQIPHPPGSPFYILLGRIFALLPIASDLAVRINLLSVFSSAGTAFFVYLSAVQILKMSLNPVRDFLNQLIVYGGAVSSAFLAAFAITNWNNAVEAEVYGLSMMILTSVFCLALLYWEKKGTFFSDKIMYLILFITYLGVGVHLTTFLILPVISFYFVIEKTTSKNVWYLLGTFFLLELYLIFAFSSKPNEISFYIPTLIVFLFFLFYVFSYEKIKPVYLAIGGTLLVSSLPVVGDLLNASGNSSFKSITSILPIVGKLGFASLLLLGIYFFFIYWRSRTTKDIKQHHLIASLFALVSCLMVLFLFPTHGFDAYKPFFILTAFLILLFLLRFAKQINWLNLIAIGGVSLVMIGVKPFFIGMLVVSILIVGLGLFKKIPGWKNALMIVVVAFIGYSTHLYIPIRSQQNPIMNENNPGESAQATIDYIERKQYGSMSMTERMFKRRGTWQNQFGVHRHMGFWGYFQNQYGTNKVSFLPFFIIGLFGIWEVVRRRASIGVPLLLAIFLASVGLILYMNFADGTRINPQTGQDYLEVRDRDYFFTPAFIFFGLAIGIGFAFIVHTVKEWAGKRIKNLTIPVTAASALLFFAPILALANNYSTASRANNYIAYDYGWNLLTSADKNAVLFTVGDNDTFTLWCLQDVYDVRTDVAVVNLSLANTKWYIKQLPTNLNVRTSWSEEYVDRMRPYRDQNRTYFGMSDQVVSEIIKQNFANRPINFSVTVPESRWKYYGKPIDSLMSLKGMVWRMNRSGGGPKVDVDSTLAFLSNPERMRLTGIDDTTIHKDATTMRLTKNFARTFIRVADTLQKAGLTEQAEEIVERAVKKVPHALDALYYLADMYSKNHSEAKLLNLIETSTRGDINILKSYLGRLYFRTNQHDKSEAVYLDLLSDNPSNRDAFDDLLRLYFDKRDPVKMKQVVQTWIDNNPGDPQMNDLLRSIDKEFERIKNNPEKR